MLSGGLKESESEGPFWFEAPYSIFDKNLRRKSVGITNRERQQLREIIKSQIFTEETLRNFVVPLNDETSDAPRLRAYDWAVTNYSKGHPKSILNYDENGFAAIVDPNLSYEGELRKHHRLLFDPFRRGNHVFFEIDGMIHRTTVGQLTFIKWCIENGVDKYVEKNLAEIRTHMQNATKKKKTATFKIKDAGENLSSEVEEKEEILIDEEKNSGLAKKRRKELTKLPTKLVRGAMMTSYMVTTDMPSELELSTKNNNNARVSEIVNSLSAIRDDEIGKNIQKAKELVRLL